MKSIPFYMVCLALSAVEGTVVQTTLGPVNGYTTSDGYEYFEGMPYAEPPTGALRFQSPVSKEAWTEVMDATSPSPVCPQPEVLYTTSEMSEDCLYLNVFTPSVTPDELLPVIIWLHGGYFVIGAGNKEPVLGPEKIVKNNIIIVTINHRLGALGFLCTGTETMPGNYGIKDVLLALEWIWNNIEYFGGDKTKLTLTGTDSGAMIANHLMFTDKSNDYFQKVMLFSGNALCSRALQRDAITSFNEFISNLNITYTDNDDMMQQLRDVDVSDIISVQTSMILNSPDILCAMNDKFLPCIEPDSSEAVVTSYPIDNMKAGSIQKKKLLIGFNDAEGLEVMPLINNAEIKKYPDRIDYINRNFEACIPRDLIYEDGSEAQEELANNMREMYLGSGNISFYNAQNSIDMFTDTAYAAPTDLFVRLWNEISDAASLYYYLLKFDSNANWFKVVENFKFPGTAHFDNIGFYFTPEATKERLANLSDAKQASLAAIESFMYNFVNYGDPSPPGTYNTSVRWVEAGKDRRHLELGDAAEMIQHGPYQDRLNFWGDVFNNYYQIDNDSDN